MDHSCTEVIHVPMKCVGRIIGSRGSKIREIQDFSQTRIQISRDEEVDGNKPVEISGTQDQIAKAKVLIEECVNYDGRSNSSRDFGGGRQWGRRDDREGGYGERRDGGHGGRRDYQQDSRGGGGGGGQNWRRRDEDDGGRGYGGSQDSWGGRSGGGSRDNWGGRSDRGGRDKYSRDY